MNDDLALAPKSFAELEQMARSLSTSALLPAALKKAPADVQLIIQTGLELGMMPMQAIRMIHVIDGKPSLSADGMAGLCLRARHVCEYITLASSTPTKATYKAKRKVGAEVELSFTIEQAKLAGLTGKQNWAKYPDAMLRARALGAISRAVFPDLVGGLHDPDELDAPIEKRVESTVEPVAQSVETLKAELKKPRKMNIVDVPEAKPSPPAPVVEDPLAIGWGVNATTRLVDMKRGALEAVIRYAEDAPTKDTTEDTRDLWADRLARYTAELARRDATAGAVTT